MIDDTPTPQIEPADDTAAAAPTAEIGGATTDPSVAENSAGDQRGKPFLPGVSGNPSGKPRGCRNKITRLAETLFDNQAQPLVDKCIAMAMSGDTVALRLAIERILPARKSRPVQIELPAVETAADLPAALSVVIEAAAQGELTPEEAAVFAGMLETKRRSFETVEIERRLVELEQREAGHGG
jgi:hypothetical protein